VAAESLAISGAGVNPHIHIRILARALDVAGSVVVVGCMRWGVVIMCEYERYPTHGQ